MSKVSFNFFQKDLESKILDMCNNIQNNNELEVSFGSLNKPITMSQFDMLLKYIKNISIKDKLNINQETSLDILYNYDNKTNSVYRITISNIEQINIFIQNNSILKNHTIFSRLIRSIRAQDEDSTDKIIIIDKVKPADKLILIDDYNMRIKLSEENVIASEDILDK